MIENNIKNNELNFHTTYKNYTIVVENKVNVEEIENYIYYS